MTDFQQRLKKAIDRGVRRNETRVREAEAKALSEEECKRLHTTYRLQISEHIETCARQMTGHFPGFEFQTVFGERGWGAACLRDDFGSIGGKRTNYYSRLEMTVRPYSSLHVLELSAKGTIRNKEVFNRNQFEKLADADPESFLELVDLWILEYAELFAAAS
jgi:hypothetical protein